MAMSNKVVKIQFPIDEELFQSLKETREEFTREVLFYTAVMLYRKRKLSLGKAAQFAGLPKVEFIQKLQQENEHIFDYSDSELDSILLDASKIE